VRLLLCPDILNTFTHGKREVIKITDKTVPIDAINRVDEKLALGYSEC
jgi:hypothetical protein